MAVAAIHLSKGSERVGHLLLNFVFVANNLQHSIRFARRMEHGVIHSDDYPLSRKRLKLSYVVFRVHVCFPRLQTLVPLTSTMRVFVRKG